MATILCIADAPAAADVGRALVSAGHTVLSVRSLAEAVELVARGGVDLVVGPAPVLPPIPSTPAAPPVATNGAGAPSVLLHSLNVEEAERVLIRHALEAAGQNRTRAAAMLGISVRTLRNRLNKPAAARV